MAHQIYILQLLSPISGLSNLRVFSRPEFLILLKSITISHFMMFFPKKTFAKLKDIYFLLLSKFYNFSFTFMSRMHFELIFVG